MWSYRPEVEGYVYKGDIYCTAHIVGAVLAGKLPSIGTLDAITSSERSVADAEAWLDEIAAERGIDRGRERTYDSDEFPKVIMSHQAHASCTRKTGCLEICGVCGEPLCGESCYGFKDSDVIAF